MTYNVLMWSLKPTHSLTLMLTAWACCPCINVCTITCSAAYVVGWQIEHARLVKQYCEKADTCHAKKEYRTVSERLCCFLPSFIYQRGYAIMSVHLCVSMVTRKLRTYFGLCSALGRQEGHPACKKTGCWFNGDDILTGALHVL